MMNLDNIKEVKISYLLLALTEKVLEIDKKARYYGTDTPLFHSEIHMIKAIKENKGIHITRLAENLGVTKGAVSQIAIKLQKKGLIVKERDINNASKFLLKLSPMGEIAYANHQKFHQDLDQILAELLNGESEEKINFLKEFLATLESELNIFEDKGF
ncbi:MarR family winged helix-turn-helix transcriptional regulator [Clostridium omnivorum]|uniref:Transcriptional regulator n=1 Tax=Clostridium omnivorum TaxID=1604902 RepID=A0ABQ5N4N0_9CLOT|nr:MarR family transcriptional regulator [Clostridium sp. E14]GLC30179.1 transcriptional regulator [Clostridium sp. E14]